MFRVFAQTTIKIVHKKTKDEKIIHNESNNDTGHGTKEDRNNNLNTWGGSNNGNGLKYGRNNDQNSSNMQDNDQGAGKGKKDVKNTGSVSHGPVQKDAFTEDKRDNESAPEPYHKTVPEGSNKKRKVPRRYGSG